MAARHTQGEKHHNVYDVCVVGAGMIGSAAARHLVSLKPEMRILLVGPSEPKDHLSTDIQGAYYDESRLVYYFDEISLNAELNRRSMTRFRDIECSTGMQFYHEVGYLGIATNDNSSLNYLKTAAQQHHTPFVELLSSDHLAKMHPYINFPNGSSGLHIKKGAGYIKPRVMVAALQLCARRGGCDIVDDIVSSVTTLHDAGECNELRTDSGRIFYAQKVLLAPGAFIQSRPLLPPQIQPDFELEGSGVIMVEIPESKLRQFSSMPAVQNNQQGSYIVPPIKYTDGKYYLKFTQTTTFPLDTPESMAESQTLKQLGDYEELLLASVKTYFPEIDTRATWCDYAIVTHTPTGVPYIDMATSSIGVAFGGCGRAAKASDEYGLIAARMILSGQWDYDLSPEPFRLQTKKIY